MSIDVSMIFRKPFAELRKLLKVDPWSGRDISRYILCEYTFVSPLSAYILLLAHGGKRMTAVKCKEMLKIYNNYASSCMY